MLSARPCHDQLPSPDQPPRTAKPWHPSLLPVVWGSSAMPDLTNCPHLSRDKHGAGSSLCVLFSKAGPTRRPSLTSLTSRERFCRAGRPDPRPRPDHPPSFRPDRGRHPRHRGHCDDDLRRWLPQPRRHRHRPGGGLRVHVSPLQGRPGRGPQPGRPPRGTRDAAPAVGGAVVPSGRLANRLPATPAAALASAL